MAGVSKAMMMVFSLLGRHCRFLRGDSSRWRNNLFRRGQGPEQIRTFDVLGYLFLRPLQFVPGIDAAEPLTLPQSYRPIAGVNRQQISAAVQLAANFVFAKLALGRNRHV